jgi:hypothetical protein
MNILIKFPTFNRPDQFFSTLDLYYKMASSKEKVHFLVTLDTVDNTMNTPEVIERLNSYSNLTYIFGESKSKIDAVNRDMDSVRYDYDIILLASDDMIPQKLGYDDIIRNDMIKFYPDTDGILFYNDGHQQSKINTLSILGRKYYQRFNYLYYPEYKSEWADNDFMEIGYLLGKQTYIDNVIIEHQHPHWGFGKQDVIHYLNAVNQSWDAQLFHKRKKQNFGIKKLSILICSLKRREKYLERLINILRPQADKFVEVLCDIDDGEISIGKKRQKLLENAVGEYVSFVDDDDLISPDYVSLVLKSIESTPDVVGMHLIMTTDGQLSGKTYHSLKYKSWYDEPGELPSWRFYYRNPNHLNPVRRELALRVGYPDISWGEDRDYSMRLLPLLTSEAYIESPIYVYEVRSNKEA